MFSNGGGGGFASGGGNRMGGLEQLFSGLFSNSDRPYEEAGKTFQNYLGQAQGTQQPFYNAGVGAIPKFQGWLDKMQNPTGFMNNLMGDYQQSPWAKYQQEQSARRYGNAGSASGLTGSTPLEQFEMQNSHDISQQDMQSWLQNVLGINTQYGAGQQNLISGGQNSANSISELLRSFGGDIAKMNFGRESERNEQGNNVWGGLFSMAKNGLFG